MTFASPAFLFIFLPLFLLLYFAVTPKLKNVTLLFGSLAFYSIDSGYAFWVLVLSIPVNHFIGHAIAGQSRSKKSAWLLTLGVVLNLLPLLIYKYWGFFTDVLNDIFALGLMPLHVSVIKFMLPAGISFFTFQGLSYLVDIYEGEIVPARSMVDFGMYHTSFPQLIAGPIVRYREIENEIARRSPSLADVQSGLMQFCFGLSKKIIIADNMGSIADRIWKLPDQQLDGQLAWLAALTYMLQIFFDFAGYSDMAIGLAKVMGFHFPQNFDQPYRSQNITEFWRRWHMTLSRWFRDYVYIPLGGNRRGVRRTYINLLIVFVLCGLWHGAAYTFILWGLYHGVCLMAERILKHRFGFELSGIAGWLLTFLLVLIGWVLFRADTLSNALFHYALMFGFKAGSEIFYGVAFYMTPDKICFMAAGLFLALAPSGFMEKIGKQTGQLMQASKPVFALACFFYAVALMAANGFNPFIYSKF